MAQVLSSYASLEFLLLPSLTSPYFLLFPQIPYHGCRISVMMSVVSESCPPKKHQLTWSQLSKMIV